MATVTNSHFVSRTSHVNCHGSSTSETKANLAQMGLRIHAMTHNGLRSLNKLGMLQMRTDAKAIARQARSKVRNTENDRPAGNIICGQGMNLIFVGVEVGPWSKTGGLGDVLGGLSPAMAAALEAPRVLDLNNSEYFSGPYGEDVVFIANDWHTALLPCYLKTMYKPRGIYKSAKVAFCTHNIAYQGRFAFQTSHFSIFLINSRVLLTSLTGMKSQ